MQGVEFVGFSEKCNSVQISLDFWQMLYYNERVLEGSRGARGFCGIYIRGALPAVQKGAYTVSVYSEICFQHKKVKHIAYPVKTKIHKRR